MALVENIKSLCDMKGTSVPKLEKELGFSKGSIYNWDKNSPSIDKVQKVANYFRVSLDRVIFGFNLTEFWALLDIARGDRDFEELSKDSDVDIVKLSENFERPSKDMIKKIAANSSSSSVSEKELLGAAGYLNDIPNSKNYVQDFEMLSDKFRKAGFLVTYPLDNDLEYVRVNYKEHGTVATMSLRHYLQDGIKIYDELVQKYKKDEPQNIKDHYRNSSIENEIMALAAHQLGHEGDLTKEQLEQIKLAIKIALAKNDK